MGTLTEQMRSLAADVTRSRDERRAWLDALREGADVMRREIRSEGRERKSWVKSLRGDVRKMCRDLRGDLRGARGAWQEGIAAGASSGAKASSARRARPSGKHGK